MHLTIWLAILPPLLTLAVLPGESGAVEPQPYESIYRLSLPTELPPHPRVFTTAADLARVRADLERGDPYTVATVRQVLDRAEGALAADLAPADAGTLRVAQALAHGYAVGGDERFGRRALAALLAVAARYPTLETTRSRGRLTDSTLHEGPLAVAASDAYDLIAGAPFCGESDRRIIEQDLLRLMGWECGHRGGHTNSSNWRSWGLTILAATGFASGDPALIEEAINGVWDPSRKTYLYGIVQQIAHSIFSDGIHWERSMGYTYYTASALIYQLEAAQNSGIDLWHADIPSLLGPFVGSAPHEEYGPPGTRSLRAFLDAPFYYAFPDLSLARIGDSGTGELQYHPIYELGWEAYQDPKYAWLIHRERDGAAERLNGWSIWRPAGEPVAELVPGAGRGGSAGFRLRTAAKERAALVQEVRLPDGRPVTVRGWVKPVAMAGGSAHLRVNSGEQAWFSNRVRETGDWQPVTVEIPAADAARPLRIHVFLEDGAGEVIWDDLTISDPAAPLLNGTLDEAPPDGRRMSYWDLINGVDEVPAGSYTQAGDASIGLTGRHVNGQTLFPVGGFAILRADPTDPDALAALLNFGPYGSGHDHPDRLHLSVYGLDEILCPDGGSWGYDNPEHLTWANQTIAHNTLTVDEVAQQPQALSNSIWAGELPGQRVFGELRLFAPGERLRVVRATCDTAYPGVTMDRTVCLVGDYLLDLFRVRSDEVHTYDLALHGLGTITGPDAGAPRGLPFTGRGYGHLTDLRQVVAVEPITARFESEAGTVQVLHGTATPGTIYFAADPARGAPRSCLISRQQEREAIYATVIEPLRGEPTARSLTLEVTADDVEVRVELADGEDRFRLPAAIDGTVTWQRAAGGARLEESAAPADN